MKILILFIVTLSVAFVQTSEESKQKFEVVAQECKSKEGVSDDEFVNLMARRDPATHEGKCLAACVFETIGMIKDGRMDKEIVLTLASRYTSGDEKKMKISESLATVCAELTDGDRCELAYKIGDCFKTEWLKKKQEYEHM